MQLSEGGEPALLTGSAAKPFFGPGFQDLLNRRILVELPPATEWQPCDSCECGLYARPIHIRDGDLIAACPLDAAADAHLTADDIRSFEINLESVVDRICTDSGFPSPPTEASDGLWFLGQTSGRAVFLCLTAAATRQLSLIQVMRGTSAGMPTTLVAPEMSGSDGLKFADAAVHLVPTATAIAGGPRHFALSPEALHPKSASTPRLTLQRARQLVTLDDQTTTFTDRPFKLLWLLAEAVAGDGRIVSKEEIEKGLFRGQNKDPGAAADAVHDLRERLKPLLRSGETPRDMVQTRHAKGYVLNMRREELKLAP